MTATLSMRLDTSVKKLDLLVKRTGRSKSFLAAEAMAVYIMAAVMG